MSLSLTQKRFLSSLNPLAIAGVVYFLILFRSTSDPIMPSVIREWDILLPFAVYIGQRRNLLEGVLLVLFISHLYSLASVAPIGVFAIHYCAVFFAARFLIYVVYADRIGSIWALLFVLALASRIVYPFIAGGFGHGWPLFSFRNLLFFGFFINSTLGVVIYWGITWIDRLTFKIAPRNIELGEGQI